MANLDELRRLLVELGKRRCCCDCPMCRKRDTLVNALPALLDRIEELEAALDYCDRAVDDIGCMDDQCNQARLDVQAKVAAMRGKENTDA